MEQPALAVSPHPPGVEPQLMSWLRSRESEYQASAVIVHSEYHNAVRYTVWFRLVRDGDEGFSGRAVFVRTIPFAADNIADSKYKVLDTISPGATSAMHWGLSAFESGVDLDLPPPEREARRAR